MTSGRLSRYLNLRVAALLLPLALAAPGGGLATTLQRFDLAQLTDNATQIFVGRCHSAKTEIESEQVYTHYLFSVEQMIKGDPAQEVHVHLLGGEVSRGSTHHCRHADLRARRENCPLPDCP